MDTITLKGISINRMDNTQDNESPNVIKAVISTVNKDRDKEQATEQFLREFASLIVGKPVAKNHKWEDVDQCVGTVTDAEVIETTDENGNNITEVVITLDIRDEEALKKIHDGRYYNMSGGFTAIKSKPDENGIVKLLSCTDAYEVSFVLVPALSDAHIIQKSYKIGGKSMNKFNLKKLFEKHPELKGLDPEVIDDIKAAETDEIKAEDVEVLIDENEALKKENEELKTELASFKEAEEVKKSEERLDQIIAEAIDGATVSDKTKEYIDSEVKAGCADTKDEDAVKEVVSTVLKKYDDLGLVEWAKQEVEEPEHTGEEPEKKEEEPEKKEEEPEKKEETPEETTKGAKKVAMGFYNPDNVSFSRAGNNININNTSLKTCKMGLN